MRLYFVANVLWGWVVGGTEGGGGGELNRVSKKNISKKNCRRNVPLSCTDIFTTIVIVQKNEKKNEKKREKKGENEGREFCMYVILCLY